MPELPDVEVFRRYCARTSLKKKISHVSDVDGQILETSESTLRRHLLDNEFRATARHGKYLFLEISDGYQLVLHFGMTGHPEYFSKEAPEYTRLAFQFGKGGLAYVCPRRLGNVFIAESIESFVEQKGLGPDVLELKKNEFVEILENTSGMAKTALMNQGKMAGIGNIYSDEILYQAGVHPERQVQSMSGDGLQNLFNVTGRVLETAIRHHAEPEEFPERYLNYDRSEGRKCSICSGEIKKKKVGGRPSYFCPRHQKKQ
ncbi:hypothetical protein GF318_00765 [Candidatus Micrarchaeota archaeon]|nr:hypothetical protein [Candidatus Micrarchaeota archaeon]